MKCLSKVPVSGTKRVQKESVGNLRRLDCEELAGLRAARAPLVARLDSDDVAFPDRLAQRSGVALKGVCVSPTFRRSQSDSLKESL